MNRHSAIVLGVRKLENRLSGLGIDWEAMLRPAMSNITHFSD
jgi:hypothetical protein